MPIALVLALFIAPFTAAAEEPMIEALHDQMTEAYSGYRSALFHLRAVEADEAAVDLAPSVKIWKALDARFRENPPGSYAQDPEWLTSLNAIGAALRGGHAAASEGDAKRAHDRLDAVRRLLSDLRHRNGYVLHSDCVNELNHLMDRLIRFRFRPPNLAKDEVRYTIATEQRLYLDQLARCRGSLDEARKAEPDIMELFDTTAETAESLTQALEAQDAKRLTDLLGELRTLDGLIFAKAG